MIESFVQRPRTIGSDARRRLDTFPRERGTLTLRARGLTNADIAEDLVVS